ncbi:hypothetical protein A2118_01730 [Candidatus Kaiserbacteria bacterium GWA2_50_9]|uniref:DNA/pantothenate metabolism flavoprotein C-terminal domain-containing protein n=1 Tax=Candidatus Kaiserbacteria bacterium GWA2_50_9 TaxID=1798474 RepID=A0A1F6BVV8_9BACT|nr:MAG: hypothetical protein A2118_01730 [Candidatus Kaiserbacteria bacterium GWA2_50_9]
MKRILITGGPVHAYLDAVKIITNRFKGGLMCQLAEALLAFDTRITYLCSPEVGAKKPHGPDDRITVVTHKGFDDYRRLVLELAPTMDGVILGAAVANLIPVNPYSGKFPSHHYKPGDVIPIDFTIAPRVIDEVKKAAPKTQLFGYKLLSGVSHDELIRAAYDIVLEARATAVLANDATNLQQKFAVTKERGVHPLRQEELPCWIWEMLSDTYYATSFDDGPGAPEEVVSTMRAWIKRYADHFLATEAGLIFGTVAVRHKSGFVTTGRGKRELNSIAHVARVDHAQRVVCATGNVKASLNAPLLARMFENSQVETIVHYHEQVPNLPSFPYAPPGSARDTARPNATSFNIQGHGCILLFDSAGGQL